MEGGLQKTGVYIQLRAATWILHWGSGGSMVVSIERRDGGKRCLRRKATGAINHAR